mgnify:CR=1 FL=1
MKHSTRSVTDRLAVLRNRWVNSKAADDMTVLDFTRFLTALDAARSHVEIDDLAIQWRAKTRTRKVYL